MAIVYFFIELVRFFENFEYLSVFDNLNGISFLFSTDTFPQNSPKKCSINVPSWVQNRKASEKRDYVR